MKHRAYNTGDQVWINNREVVKVLTGDGLSWSKEDPHLTKVSGLYQVSQLGDQTWFGERYGRRVVTKIITHDGRVWSEEDPTMKQMVGVELFIHQVTTFFLRLILRTLA